MSRSTGQRSRGSRRIGRLQAGIALAVVAVVAAFAPIPAGPARAANPSADIDQCKNGSTTNQISPCDWVNGSLGTNNSHYQEGDSVPFRIRFDNLATTGSHTVTIEWDTTKSGKHAYDYLTTWNRTETNADPCDNVTGCTVTPPPLAIPNDPNIPANDPSGPPTIVQVPGVFTMWNGTLTSASAYTVAGSYAGDSSTRITLTFTAAEDDPVLAWAGHIASEADWGAGTSASGIAGSPYHMRLIDLDGSGGNQDRSLKVGNSVGSITIVKQAGPESSRQFNFTASDNLDSFTLVDDGNDATAPFNAKTFAGLTNFSNNHTYDFTEAATTGWQLSSITCDSNKVTKDLATGTVKVQLEAETNVTCTFTNNDLVPTITVTKTPSPTSVPESGGAVSYAVSVHNDSTVESVTLTSLVDDKFGNVTTIAGSTCSTPQTIAANTSYNCSFTQTVAGDAPTTHVNTVTGTATDQQSNSITDDGSATVTFTDVLPVITVDKSASASTVRSGSSVTYTYQVSTAGTESLTNVSVVDDKCSPVGFTGGDTDGDSKLDPGETWTYTCTTTLTGDTVNTATATAKDDEDNTATDTDTATVDVIDPKIAIDKVANPKSANPGDTVAYGYTVTNPGNDPLTNVSVVDDKCSPVTFVGGDTDGDGKLDTGESWTYTCSVVVGTGSSSVTNIGTATAKDSTGATVSASDSETIAIVEAVSVVRQADPPADPPAVLGVDLPRTGSDIEDLATTGAALVLAGIAMVAVGWRRRRPQAD